MIHRRHLLAAVGVASLGSSAKASESARSDPTDRRLREDWAWLDRYAEDNRRLIEARRPITTVFLGDSITEGWRDKRPAFFKDGMVGRGIGGQTTPQMLVRMMSDVVALRPRFVHIMAGTNDIAGNTGPMSRVQTFDMVAGMTSIARAHGIGVLLASIPPAAAFPWRPGLETIEAIREINAWAADHAVRTGGIFIDYTPALATAAGGMRDGLAYDGVHPNEAGYAVMESVLMPVLMRLEASQ